MEKKYEKENVEDGVVRIDSVQHVVHYAGVGMGGRWTQNTNIDNGLIAYYDFENVNEKKVPNVKDQSKYEGELKGSNVSIASDTIFGKSLKFTEGNWRYYGNPSDYEYVSEQLFVFFVVQIWYEYK